MKVNEQKGVIPNTLAQNSFVSITEKRNKRDVWNVATQGVKEAHFATFPEKLIEPCIFAGSQVGGGGARSVLRLRYNRNRIGKTSA